MEAMRRRVNNDENDGYFASISDLMVGVLFVFLLMLTVFALNFRDQAEVQLKDHNDALTRLAIASDLAETARREAEVAKHSAEVAKQSAEQERQRAAELERRLRRADILLRDAQRVLTNEIEGRQAQRDLLLRTLERQMEARGIRVSVDSAAGILRLPGDDLFRTSRSELTGPRSIPGARERVRALADVMVGIVPCYVANVPAGSCAERPTPLIETILIEGHTDRQPFPGVTPRESEELNNLLSTSRALAVALELRERQRILDELINADGNRVLGVSGYGEHRPLPEARGNTEPDFRQNRRIDLRFVLTAPSTDQLFAIQRQIDELLGHAR